MLLFVVSRIRASIGAGVLPGPNGRRSWEAARASRGGGGGTLQGKEPSMKTITAGTSRHNIVSGRALVAGCGTSQS